jgi:hypothetical protein
MWAATANSVNTGMYMNSRRVVYVALGEIQITAVDAGNLIEFQTTMKSKYLLLRKMKEEIKGTPTAPVMLKGFISIGRKFSEKAAPRQQFLIKKKTTSTVFQCLFP